MLTSLKKAIMSVTGILVIAAVTLFLLFFPASCGKFGCSYEPTWWPIAAASSDCPGSLNEASVAFEWASGIHSELGEYDGKTTAGWLFSGVAPHEGAHVKLWSGVTEHDSGDDDPLYAKARDLVKAHRVWSGAATHVEAKAVAHMVENGERVGYLVINHPSGPCDGCTAALNELLPALGVELTIYYMHRGTLQRKTYPGG